LVEHAIENRSVGGSIPSLGTIFPYIVGCSAGVDDDLQQIYARWNPLKSLPIVSVA
jgi:hypothetical protein